METINTGWPERDSILNGITREELPSLEARSKNCNAYVSIDHAGRLSICLVEPSTGFYEWLALPNHQLHLLEADVAPECGA